MIGPSDYKLEHLLILYGQYLSGEKSGYEFEEEKKELADKTLKILALGVGQYSEAQARALKEFSNRFSKDFSDDKVVSLVSKFADDAIINPKLREKQITKDLDAAVGTFENVSGFEALSSEKKHRIATHAIHNILHAGKGDAPINYTDLAQFTKILIVSWKEPYLMNSHDALAKQLIFLTGNVAPEEQERAHEFTELAMNLIKLQEMGNVPEEISKHPGYHGKALEAGLDTLGKMVKKTGKTNKMLITFVETYCEDHLKPMEYLIRNSSTVPSTDKDETKYFVATVSYKKGDKKLYHSRITRLEHEDGMVSWKLNQPPFKPGDKEAGYDSLEELMKLGFKAYKFAAPPTPVKLSAYVNHYTILNEEQ